MENIQYGIAWQESYRLGDERVDRQHRQIFALLSGLISSCLDGSNEEHVKKTLDFLVNYTVHHFFDEETLQLQYEYPEYARHKVLHEDFKATVTRIVEKYEKEGSSAELCNDLNKIVARWLVSHITREDRKIGEFIRKADRSRFSDQGDVA